MICASMVRAADWRRAMTNLRFVMTGGPGAGKTTLLQALAARGYLHASDSARAIIRGLYRMHVKSGHNALCPEIRTFLDNPRRDTKLPVPVFFWRLGTEPFSMSGARLSTVAEVGFPVTQTG